MNHTAESPGTSTGDVETVRKVYARDIKVGDAVHTVFKATAKERHTTRAGKTFLALELFDKTAALDARVFEQVDVAEKAFVNDDYLLVKGKVITFHGKAQLVIDQLERLDPEPIDGREFTSPPRPAPAPRAEAPARPTGSHKQLRQRLNALLDDPEVAAGLHALLGHLEQYVDDRVAARLSGEEKPPRQHRHDEPKRHRGPRPAVEVKPKVEGEAKSEPKAARDPSLPRELAFKPFTELAAAEGAAAEPAAEPQAPKSPAGS